MGVRGSAKRRRRRAPCSSAGANSKGESRFAPISGGDDGNALERNSKKQRTAEASSSASPSGAGADLISCLGDDMLVRILELLPDARDAVRTDALSRRWRGLWTRVPALRFDSGTKGEFKNDPAGRFVAFVDHALALRATEREPLVEHLAILLDIGGHDGEGSEELMPPSVEAAQGWIHHAMQQGVKSLTLSLGLPWFRTDEASNDEFIERPVMTLDGLASSAKLETMHLKLSSVKLRLPSTAVFASLTDLSLEFIRLEAGGGHLLARLVSTACCPHLHRLQLRCLEFSGMEPLLIDAAALLELSLGIKSLQFLELRTPSLRVLDVMPCYKLEGLRVSAPSLEDIELLVRQPLHIDVDGDLLSSVGRLKIVLYSHRHMYDDDTNGGSIRLLECCRLTRCLEVSLIIPKMMKQYVDIIKGRIPQLPHVTSLTMDVTLWGERSDVAGIASLLAQCNNVRYLSLIFFYVSNRKKNVTKLDLPCDTSGLAHLQEAEFKLFMGTDHEFQLIQFILTRASGIQKVDISLSHDWVIKRSEDGLKLMPPLAGGSWTTCNDTDEFSYKWRRCA